MTKLPDIRSAAGTHWDRTPPIHTDTRGDSRRPRGRVEQGYSTPDAMCTVAGRIGQRAATSFAPAPLRQTMQRVHSFSGTTTGAVPRCIVSVLIYSTLARSAGRGPLSAVSAHIRRRRRRRPTQRPRLTPSFRARVPTRPSGLADGRRGPVLHACRPDPGPIPSSLNLPAH